MKDEMWSVGWRLGKKARLSLAAYRAEAKRRGIKVWMNGKRIA